jgi:hypothetical protein
MLPVKFSSARRRSILRCLLRAAGKESVANALGIEMGFHLSTHVLSCEALCGKIRLYRLAVTQVKRDDRIDVHQRQDRVVMRDLFCRCPIL